MGETGLKKAGVKMGFKIDVRDVKEKPEIKRKIERLNRWLLIKIVRKI